MWMSTQALQIRLPCRSFDKEVGQANAFWKKMIFGSHIAFFGDHHGKKIKIQCEPRRNKRCDLIAEWKVGEERILDSHVQEPKSCPAKPSTILYLTSLPFKMRPNTDSNIPHPLGRTKQCHLGYWRGLYCNKTESITPEPPAPSYDTIHVHLIKG